jgi:hypothetical protein
MSNHISDQVKKHILMQQYYKCANAPYKPAVNLHDYLCLQWKYNNGDFDEAGYKIHHINEFGLTLNNRIDNIQALCPNCYAVKVSKFLKQRQQFTSTQLANGMQYMDIE